MARFIHSIDILRHDILLRLTQVTPPRWQFLKGTTGKLDYRLQSLAVVACGALTMVAMSLFVSPRAWVNLLRPFITDLFTERVGQFCVSIFHVLGQWNLSVAVLLSTLITFHYLAPSPVSGT